MCDTSCHCPTRSIQYGGATFGHNHCHYEHHSQDSRGPLHRTTASSTRDCHQQHPASHGNPCPSTQRPLCLACGEPRQLCTQQKSPEDVNVLEDLLGEVTRDQGLLRDLRDVIRPSNSEYVTRDYIEVIINEVLDRRETRSAQDQGNTTASREALREVLLLQLAAVCPDLMIAAGARTPQPLYGSCPHRPFNRCHTLGYRRRCSSHSVPDFGGHLRQPPYRSLPRWFSGG
jgi:hypothetical protein